MRAVRSPSIWSLAAALCLGAAGVAVVVIHDHSTWGQPVESGAAVAAALLTALTAVAAAISARDSARAARDARRALLLHNRPVFDWGLDGRPGEIPRLWIGLNPLPKSGVSVEWTGTDGVPRQGRLANKAGGFVLTGSVVEDGPEVTYQAFQATWSQDGGTWRLQWPPGSRRVVDIAWPADPQLVD